MEEIICNKYFPSKKTDSTIHNLVLLSLGANLNNPIKTFMSLFRSFRNNKNISILSTSPIYKNPPFGFKNQNMFYNVTILLSTRLYLLELYKLIFYLERRFGRARKRAFKNAPRSLDIDIIFFNNLFLRSKKLNIPHLHWQERNSVLIPLLYQVNYKGF